MQNQVIKTIPTLLFLVMILFTYSCQDKNEVDPVAIQELESSQVIDLRQEGAKELLEEKIIAIQKADISNEPQDTDIKTPKEVFQDFQEITNSEMMMMSFCQSPPNCPSLPQITDVIGIAPCDFQFTYKAYLCGTTVGIYNFQILGTSGNGVCPRWQSILDLRANGFLIEAQSEYNVIASNILSYLEDWFNINYNTNTVGQFVVLSAVPNICSVTCNSLGVQEECGLDCCIRVGAYQNSMSGPAVRTSTTVSSAEECGGDPYTCGSGTSTSDCKNYFCENLDIYVQ